MKKWLKRLREDERGLTLVELLAVVVVLAIVGIIAFVAIGNVIENSKKDAHVANAQQLISAAKLAEASHDFPTGGFYTENYTPVPTDGRELDTIEDLTNPWNATSAYEGKVTKDDDGNYLVTITGEDIPTDIAITDTPESKINEGRKGFTD